MQDFLARIREESLSEKTAPAKTDENVMRIFPGSVQVCTKGFKLRREACGTQSQEL